MSLQLVTSVLQGSWGQGGCSQEERCAGARHAYRRAASDEMLEQDQGIPGLGGINAPKAAGPWVPTVPTGKRAVGQPCLALEITISTCEQMGPWEVPLQVENTVRIALQAKFCDVFFLHSKNSWVASRDSLLQLSDKFSHQLSASQPSWHTALTWGFFCEQLPSWTTPAQFYQTPWRWTQASVFV